LHINHENIAKGIRDPRVEVKNTDQASISILTKQFLSWHKTAASELVSE